MAMTVADLKSLLSKVTPSQPFTLSDGALGIDAVKKLFDSYLPGQTLTVDKPTADVEQLTVSGGFSLPPKYTGLPVMVTFDSDGTNVTGIFIRAALPGWDIDTSFLQLSPAYLKDFGCSVLYLVLSAQPGDTGQVTAAYGVGADFSFKSEGQTETLSLNALMSQDPAADYTLEGTFSGVTLSDLNVLSQFATGGQFDIIPSNVVPLAKQMQLTGLRLAIGRAMSKLLVVSVNVQVTASWAIVPGKFEFKSVGATFTVNTPSSPTIYAALYTTFDVGGVPIAAQVTIPDLDLTAALEQPIQFSQILAQYLPNSDLPELNIDFLRFQLNLRSVGYSLQVATTEDWPLVNDGGFSLSLTGLFFTIIGQGSSTPTGTVGATFDVGGTGILISASYLGSTSGWQFLGETIGDSTIDAGKLASSVLSQFGVTLPAPVQKVQIGNVALEITTGTKTFFFTATGTTTVADVAVSFSPTIKLSYDSQTHSFDKVFSGTLVLHAPQQGGGTKDITFTVSFSQDAKDTSITATYQQSGTGLEFADIAGALGFTVSQPIPSSLDLGLTAASFTYDFTSKSLVLAATSKNYGKAVFVTLLIDAQRQYFFLLGVNKTFSLSNLPLVGEELAKIENISLGDLSVIIGSETTNSTTAAVVNALIPAGYPTLPAAGANGDVVIAAQLSFGDQVLALDLALGGQGTTSRPDGALALATVGAGQVSTSSTPDGTMWYTVQKSFGPVSIQRIGAMYQSDQQTLWFEIDATLAFGPLTLDLVGLGLGSPIASFEPKFSLTGLGVAYSNPPLEVAGSLVNLRLPEQTLSNSRAA